MSLLQMVKEWKVLQEEQIQSCTPANCSHPSGPCSSSDCQSCLDEIHSVGDFGKLDKREKYNCENLILCYIDTYVQRYYENIKYICSRVNFPRYDELSVLSIGCGPAPDLMAFEKIAKDKNIRYNGVDENPLWNNIHNMILDYAANTPNLSVNFESRDIYESNSQSADMIYNVVVMQFLLSSLLRVGQKHDEIRSLFKAIIDGPVKRWKNSSLTSPFLFVLNDNDSMNTGRNLFHILLVMLEESGYTGTAYARSQHSGGDLGKSRWGSIIHSGYGSISYEYCLRQHRTDALRRKM